LGMMSRSLLLVALALASTPAAAFGVRPCMLGTKRDVASPPLACTALEGIAQVHGARVHLALMMAATSETDAEEDGAKNAVPIVVAVVVCKKRICLPC